MTTASIASLSTPESKAMEYHHVTDGDKKWSFSVRQLEGTSGCSYENSRAFPRLFVTILSFLSPEKRLPVIKSVRGYSWNKLCRDLLAGLTVALTTVPYCIALSSISGLEPDYPLGASIIGNVVYALLGTARDLNIGSTAAVALLMKVYADMGCKEYVRFLTLYTGVIEILFGVLQLSPLVNYVSPTVLSAFITTTSLTIIISQLKSFLGLHLISNSSEPSALKLYHLLNNITHINWSDFIMGLLSLTTLFLLRFLATKNKLHKKQTYSKTGVMKSGLLKIIKGCVLMSNVSVMGMGCAVVYIFGHEILNVTLVRGGLDGKVLEPQPFPFHMSASVTNNRTACVNELLGLTDVEFGLITVPLLAMLFTIAVAKSFGRKNDYRIDVTQEFLAFGVANVTASFFKSFPIAASISRTAVNSHCKVASPISGLFSSVFVVLIVLFASSTLHYIPQSCLSAVTIVSVLFSIDVHTVRTTFYAHKYDFIVIVTTILAGLLMSPQLSLLLGILISLLFLLIPMSRPNPRIEHFRDGRLIIARFDHGLAFPASELLLDFFIEHWQLYSSLRSPEEGKPIPKLCIVDMNNIHQIDYSILHSFVTAKEYFESRGTHFVFTQPSSAVKMFLTRVAENNLALTLDVLDSFEDAIKCYRNRKKTLRKQTKYSSMSLRLNPGTTSLIDSHEMQSLYASLYP